MRISRGLAVAVTGASLAAAVTLPAVAGTTHHPAGKTGTFHSTLSQTKHVKNGTKLTLKAKGAEKKVTYTCVFAIVKGKNANSPNLGNIAHATANKKGKFSCSLTFHPFTGTINGKTAHCPPSKADKKAGIKCGFAAADPANSQGSNTIQYFS
jgi:hypothetical protein